MDDFEAVSGVLRLSHKYMVDSLRTKAIEHLHNAWPITLQGWDKREEIARWYNGEWNTGGGRYPHPTVNRTIISMWNFQLTTFHSVSLTLREL